MNYVAAINARYGTGVTRENNAAVLLVRAFGPNVLKKETRRAVLAGMGMAPMPQKGQYFQDLRSYLRAQEAPETKGHGLGVDLYDTLREAGAEPWTAKESPVLAGWLRANARPLAVLVQATTRPRFFVPWVSGSKPPTCTDGLDRFRWFEARAGARALTVRAMLRAGERDFEAAAADVMAVHLLARLLGQGPLLVDHLVAVGTEALACSADHALAGCPKLTASQARAHLVAIQALPRLPSTADVLDSGERLFALDVWTQCSRQGVRKTAGDLVSFFDIPPELLPEVGLDWDGLLRMANSSADRQVAACRKPTFRERRAAAERLRAEIETEVGKTKEDRIAYARKLAELAKDKPAAGRREITRRLFFLFENIGCVWARASQLRDHVVMRRRLGEVALALRAHKADKGRFPPSLALLKPAYLKRIPGDIFVDGPLVYRRQGRGYCLYSVGENLKDDGGKVAGPEGDVVVRASD